MQKGKGGKREGAGRPLAPLRPKPVSWRPKTQAARDKYLELGGGRWLDRVIDEAQAVRKSSKGSDK